MLARLAAVMAVVPQRLFGILWWLLQLLFVNANLFTTASVTVQLIHQCTFFRVCESCDQGFFASGNSTLFNSNCLPCSSCEEGQGIEAPCNQTHDTDCKSCAEGSYSGIGEEGRKCFTCDDCLSNGRLEVSSCTQTANSICGECASGYFLYIDSDGSQCLECSQCPDDRVAIHWIECAEAGLEQDHQCAPGEVPRDNSSSTTEVPTLEPTNQPTTPQPVDPTIPTDRGGFVEQAETKPLTTAGPAKEIGIAIKTVSAVFTFCTVLIFLCAIGYVAKRRCTLYCKKLSARFKARSFSRIIPQSEEGLIEAESNEEQTHSTVL